jgi:Bacterial Ig-like domain
MKSYPVVRLGRLAALISLSACSANNGTLFNEPSEPDPSAAGPPRVEEEMTAAPAPVAPAPAPVDAAMSSDLDLVEAGLMFGAIVPGRVEPEPTTSAQEPEPAAAPEGPSIISVSPEDGAIGIASDANIVIRFSEPMDREATEAAYQSENVPSDSVSFLWNEASTELTVVPDAPLEYATGSDPGLVEARRVNFFVSSSAADAEGRHLAEPFESSFSLLRQIELSLFAVQDRDLSGSFRSNDTYGSAQCARAQINLCVGDSRVDGQNEQYKGFISFELVDVPAPLPDEIQDLSAVLSMQITAVSGNPGGLGNLVLEHASFDVIGAEAFAAPALDELARIDVGGAGSTLRADVSTAFMADRLERGLTQYRLHFEDDTDGDTTSDTLLSAWDTQTIDVSYLLP